MAGPILATPIANAMAFAIIPVPIITLNPIVYTSPGWVA